MSALFTVCLHGLKLEALLPPPKLRLVALTLHHKNCPILHPIAQPMGTAGMHRAPEIPRKERALSSTAAHYSTGQTSQRASSQNKGICENSSRQISNALRRRVLFQTLNPAEKGNEGRNPKVHQRRAVLRMEPTEASQPGWEKRDAVQSHQ